MSDPAGLRVVRAANPSPMTLDGTRTFVVGLREPVVIDPGPDDPDHRAALLRELAGATPRSILLTHSHPDHAAGAAALARAVGGAVAMAPGALGTPYPAPPVERSLADAEAIPTDAGEVRVVLTPGHAPEHAAFHWPAGGAAFVGDLLMGEGDTALVAPPEGDLGAYLRSLDRVEALGARVLYPAHGEPLRDPAAALRRYRAHRAERLAQLREALAAHPGASPAALVRAIYGDALPAALRQAAEGSVAAMLTHLRGGPRPPAERETSTTGEG